MAISSVFFRNCFTEVECLLMVHVFVLSLEFENVFYINSKLSLLFPKVLSRDRGIHNKTFQNHYDTVLQFESCSQ